MRSKVFAELRNEGKAFTLALLDLSIKYDYGCLG